MGWQIAGDPRSVVVPPPSAWLAALARLTAAGDLLPAVATTVSTYLAALATAVIAGVGLGVLIGASRRADRLLTPSLDSLASVPGAAMVPLTLLLFGFTFVANVLIVVLVAVWPVLHATTTAMRSVPAVRLDMSRTVRPVDRGPVAEGRSPVTRPGHPRRHRGASSADADPHLARRHPRAPPAASASSWRSGPRASTPPARGGCCSSSARSATWRAATIAGVEGFVRATGRRAASAPGGS